MLAAAVPARPGPPTSLEPRRRCFEGRSQAAVEACSQALRLGLAPRAAAVVRQALLDALVELGRFEAALDVLRQAAAAAPSDAEAQRELGSGLLHLAGNAEAAVAALQASLRLRADEARTYGELGLALHRLGQHPEAVAAFAEAERLQPGYFEDRPAARAAYDAARRGEGWP